MHNLSFSKNAIIRVVVCLVVLAALAAYDLAIARAEATEATAASQEHEGQGPFLKDGTFQGKSHSYGGIMTVQVKVESGYITDIQVLSHYDDSPYIDKVKEAKIPEIEAKQSLDLDVVTNASYSSHGLLYAVRNALSDADALPDDMKTSLASSKTSSQTLADTALTLDDLVGAKARETKAQGSLSGFATAQ